MSSQVNSVLRVTLARSVAAARQALGLTQASLATAAGVSRATIIQIESGEGGPRLSTVASLAEALGTSPMVLLIGPAEIEALARLVDDPSLIEKAQAQLSEDEVAKMQEILATRLPRSESRVAKMSGVAATTAGGVGHVAGAAAGVAIGSVLLPGLGSAIGGTLGAIFGAATKRNRPSTPSGADRSSSKARK